MNIYLLYALLPLVIFPLTGVIMVKVSREIGSLLSTFLRQITLLLVWIPIIFMNPGFIADFVIYHREILLSWFFWSLYLFSIFKACEYIEVLQWRVINVTSRIVTSIVVGLLFIWEKLSIWDIVWIIVILLWISMYLYIKNSNVLPKYNLPLWVAISAGWWMLFVGSQYYFSIYAKAVSPVSAAYMLELWSIPFLMIMILLTVKIKNIKKLFSLPLQKYQLVFLWSAPALLGSYWLAVSYANLDFILVNILFCATLVVAGIFWYLILWEKITKLQSLIFSCILVWIFLVNYF